MPRLITVNRVSQTEIRIIIQPFLAGLQWVMRDIYRPIEDDNGKIYIYYASSDTRLHVAESTVNQLVDYCLHTPTDGFRSIESVKRIITMVNHNKQYLKQ